MKKTAPLLFVYFFLVIGIFFPESVGANSASGWFTTKAVSSGPFSPGACPAGNILLDVQSFNYNTNTPALVSSLKIKLVKRATNKFDGEVAISNASATGTICWNPTTHYPCFYSAGGTYYDAVTCTTSASLLQVGNHISSRFFLRPKAFDTQDVAHVSPTGGALFSVEPSYQIALNSFPSGVFGATGVSSILFAIVNPSNVQSVYNIAVANGGTGIYTISPRGFTQEGLYTWHYWFFLNGTAPGLESSTPISVSSYVESFIIGKSSFTGTYGTQIAPTLQPTLELPAGGGSVRLNWSIADVAGGSCTGYSRKTADSTSTGIAGWALTGTPGKPIKTNTSVAVTVSNSTTFDLDCWNASGTPVPRKSVQVNVLVPACTPVAGICGSSAGATACATPSTNRCADGATPPVAGSNPYSWTCPGTCGGGSSPLCTTTVPLGCVAVNDDCSPACGAGTKITQYCEECEGTVLKKYNVTEACNAGACPPGYREVAPW